MFNALLALPILHAQIDPLDAIRQAVNYKAFSAKEHWQMTGTAQYQGVPCTYSLKLSSNNRFSESILGQFRIITGCDGTTSWEQDWNRTVRNLVLEDEESSLGVAGVVTPRWLDPNGSFEVTPTDLTRGLWDVRLKGKVWHAEMKVDPMTHLPQKVTYHGSNDDTVLTFTGANKTGGFWVPAKIEIEQAKQVNTVRLANVKAVADFPLEAFQKPAPPQDTTFKTSTGKVEIKKLISGHLAVHPLVNGKDVGWFIWDSGAGVTVINRKTADALSSPALGKTPLVGIAGIENGAYRKLTTFQVGPVTVKNTLAVDLDLSALGAALGIKIVGIVGYDFMSRIVADVDLKAPALVISDPASYKLPENGVWQDAVLEGRTPCVECEYGDGQKGPFRIDTGANGSVVMFQPIVKSQKLIDGQKTAPVALGGVGGMTTVQMGKLKRFVLGGHVFEDAPAMFATDPKGSFADPYLHGNLGHDFLNVFRLVFDYTHSRIGFVPRG